MKKILAGLMFFAPVAVFAQVTDADSLAARLINLGNLFVYVLISLAIIYLIFGVVRYLIAGGDDYSRCHRSRCDFLNLGSRGAPH
jgi:Na+/H+-dicarboxylate symporter